jgi:hypothetical protein
MRLLNNMVLIRPQEHKAITDDNGMLVECDPPIPPAGMAYGTILDYSPYCTTHGMISIGDYVLYRMTSEPFTCPIDRKPCQAARFADLVAVMPKPGEGD